MHARGHLRFIGKLLSALAVAVCASIGLARGDALAGSIPATTAPPPASTCSTDSTVFGVLGDGTTVGVTVFSTDGTGNTTRYGPIAIDSVGAGVRAMAALDPAALLLVDSAGVLREVTVSGSRATGFASHERVIRSGWNADALAYDGAGDLFSIVGGHLLRYSVSGDQDGIGISSPTDFGNGFALDDMVALGPNTVVGVTAAGAWIAYTLSTGPRTQPAWTAGSLGTPPSAAAGRSALVAAATGATASAAGSGAAGSPVPAAQLPAPTLSSFALASLRPGGVMLLPGQGGSSLFVFDRDGTLAPIDQATVIDETPKAVPVPTLDMTPPGPAGDVWPAQTLLSIASNGCELTPGTTTVVTSTPTTSTTTTSTTTTATATTIPTVIVDAKAVVGRTRSYSGFTDGWCTQGAAFQFHAATGHWMDIAGDAWRWAVSARNAGWAVTTVPHAASVVVFQPYAVIGRGILASELGHVAWVDAVSKRADGFWFHILEMDGPAGRGNWDQQWVKDDASTNPRTGQPNMQFILAA